MQEEEASSSYESPLDSVPIWFLSDNLLARIFAFLNAKDRFGLTQVCTRWASVSRMDWTDVTCLDLSPISPENVGPIIQLCPKLESITAQDCELNIKSISENLRGGLKSLSLYRVSAKAGLPSSSQSSTSEGLCEAVFSELRSLLRLEELILSELRIGTVQFNRWSPSFQLPDTLKRLQLSSLAFCSARDFMQIAAAPWDFAAPRDTLDCLILETGEIPLFKGRVERLCYAFGMPLLFRLRQLRELCPVPVSGYFILDSNDAVVLVRDLRLLEVLCLDIGAADTWADLSRLLRLWDLPLRILIITGYFNRTAEELDELILPPRRRYPNGFDSDPVPLLHVFIGGPIAQKIRFTPSDAVEIHPITLPMPAFLEQPEIAEIFKDCWIAEMIKRGEKSNARLWDYDARTAQSVLFAHI